MFSTETYIARRHRLRELVGSGLILLPGNTDSPCNYPNNGYYPFRQDSSFLYFFGLNREGLTGVIDADSGEEVLFGDDIDIDDIVWYGSVESVAAMAEQAGVAHSRPIAQLQTLCDNARKAGRTIHFLPPYRHQTMIALMDLLHIHPNEQRQAASHTLRMAVIEMRSTKEPQEIEEMERACEIGYHMHTTAMRLTKPGVTEKFIGGQVDGIAHSYGAMVSFPTIFTQHGEIMHGLPTAAALQSGRLALCDSGAETLMNYCSDHTRTMPVNGRYTQQQLDIYSIVEQCHDHVLQVARPGVKYFDVHMSVCRLMTTRLQELGLMRGDIDASVEAGAHALFLPHGLGHMVGMDVHDMEGLDQKFVGFDSETQPRLDQFGTNALRMGRRLQKGFVVTDEPGIYFIPDLIDNWRAQHHCEEFICFDRVETFRDFGGIRIEDDLLIEDNGCRFLGKQRIPYHPADVEAFMAQ